MNWNTERELQEDLAQYLRKCELMTFTEILMPNTHGGRIDVVAVKPYQYMNKDVRVYEVKLTRNVFLNDLNAGKYTKYLDICHRFYFAAPQGLISKAELPKEAGLICRNENGWHVVKAPRLNKPTKLDANVVFSLLFRGYEEEKKNRRLRDKIIADDNASLIDQARKIGHTIAKRLNRDRETQIEAWATGVNELFKKHLNIDVDLMNMPDTYNIEHILIGIGNLTKELQNIEAIGKYLSGLHQEEEYEGRYYAGLKKLREEAMRGL